MHHGVSWSNVVENVAYVVLLFPFSLSLPLFLSLPLSLFFHLLSRSQRDVTGEKERRLRRLQELEEKLKRVESEMKTADNDRNQFHHAMMRSAEAYKEKE